MSVVGFEGDDQAAAQHRHGGGRCRPVRGTADRTEGRRVTARRPDGREYLGVWQSGQQKLLHGRASGTGIPRGRRLVGR
jgi:hypothetical protein